MDFGGGSGGSKKSPSAPPNLYGAAETMSDLQNQYIGQQTMQNRPNISTPFATEQWGVGPDGRPTLTTGFSGPLAGAATGIQNQIAGQAGTPLPTGEAGRQAASDAVYNQYASRLDPQWNQRQSALESQMVNQGLGDPFTGSGNAGASVAAGDFNRARNDAYTSAMRDAAVTGMGQQALSFQQDLAGRNLPFQQLQSLQGLTQTPGFNAAGQFQAPNYLGAAEAMGGFGAQNFAAQQAKKGNTFGGLGSLGGGIAGLIGRGG